VTITSRAHDFTNVNGLYGEGIVDAAAAVPGR
jgi:hypothetical protein